MRSSAQALEGIAKTLSEEGGRFGLTCTNKHDAKGVLEQEWTAAMEWGNEVPGEDSEMYGAAAYGVGRSAGEAIDRMLDEAGVRP